MSPCVYINYLGMSLMYNRINIFLNKHKLLLNSKRKKIVL